MTSALDVGPAPPTVVRSPGEALEVGAMIGGRYKLIEPLGEGGMGAVYMAQQTEPVKRLVAIKLIKPGMDSRQVLARFAAERQALALMDHPGIASVLDAGTTEQGRPYFVMELVKGVPITKYCDDHRLEPADRLKLFIQVCQAVQHAHQKGIIHRDLKPSNILVARYDGLPVPKVIDFGVAKAMGQPLTDRTLVTGFGAVVGTPEYMAPEQAEFNQLDIDTRSDVYALGVLLYELLTGNTPLTRQRLGEAAVLEMLRLIREEEPPTPSTRLSQADASPSIAANRGMEPRKLTTLVRGELDWIVMKSLEKDRTRRYETANAFARDIQNYLADEPVEAAKPSAGYRLWKFARKYRAPLRAAAAAFVLLVVATAVSLFMAYRAQVAEDNALQAAGEVSGRGAARAREELATREAVQVFFQDKILKAGRPEGLDGGLGKDVTLRQAIDAAVPGIAESFRDRPAVEGALRHIIGDSYALFGEKQKSLEQLEQAVKIRTSALGLDDPETLRSMDDLANIYTEIGRTDEGSALADRVHQARERVLGHDHQDTMLSVRHRAGRLVSAGKAPEAKALLIDLIPRLKALLGYDHPDTLYAMAQLASAYNETHSWGDAANIYDDVLEASIASPKLGPRHPNTFRIVTALCGVLVDIGDYDRAIERMEQSYPLQEEILGAHHPFVLQSMDTLALNYKMKGMYDKAIRLRETIRDRERERPTLTPLKVAANLCKLADCYLGAGQIEKAVEMHQADVSAFLAVAKADDPATMRARSRLAQALLQAGRLDQGIKLLEEVVKDSVAKPGPDAVETTDRTVYLIKAHLDAGHLDLAQSITDAFLEGRRRRVGPNDPSISANLADLGRMELAHKRYAEAARHFRLECMDIREKTVPDDWITFNARSLLGGALAASGDQAAAEPLLLTGYLGIKERVATVFPRYLSNAYEALDRLIAHYEAVGGPQPRRPNGGPTGPSSPMPWLPALASSRRDGPRLGPIGPSCPSPPRSLELRAPPTPT